MWSPKYVLWLTAVSSLAYGAEPVTVEFQPGVDQAVVMLLTPPHASAPVILLRQFLEPRKARYDHMRAATESLLIRDQLTGRTAPLLTSPAGIAVWVGAPLVTESNITLPIRPGEDTPLLYTVDYPAMKVREAPLPWQKSGHKTKARSYERLFPLKDAIVAVRSDSGVPVADIWRNADTTPTTLDLSDLSRNGTVTSIEDVVEFGGRITLLLTTASPQNNYLVDFWIASLDTAFALEIAKVTRLETGLAASGQAEFIRSKSGVMGIRALVRTARTARPVVFLFAVGKPTRALWSAKLNTVEAGNDVTIVGVCQRSFVVTQTADTPTKGMKDIEFSVVGPAGQYAVLGRIKVGKSVLPLTSLAEADGERLWSVINLTQFEQSRRSDGWYGWRAFRVDQQPVKPFCQFEK